MDYLTYPLFALNCDRKTTKLFYSPIDLMAFIKAEGFYNFGHREWITHDRRWDRHGGYTYVARPYLWVVRDDRGRPVHVGDFCEAHRVSWVNSWHTTARAAAEKGLPIPRTGKRKWHRHHAPAKKNSGAGHRNRNRALAIYEFAEYDIPNRIGGRVIPWEGH